MRFFNTAGPVNETDHYCLPPLERLDPDYMNLLIEQKKYFVLHAPRQTGKTSSLLALMNHLNSERKYRSLYVNAEVGQSAGEDVKRGIKAILSELATCAHVFLKDEFLEKRWREVLNENGEDAALGKMLTLWAEESSKPLILMIDEIDSLIGNTLISVLRQLRTGYTRRPLSFPQSIVLCGVRDVRDYRIHSSQNKEIITGGSAFNIKAVSLRLGDFTQKEIASLYQQHTEETGQIFTEDALETAWRLTEGQPWLINALGYEACFNMKTGQNRTDAITASMMDQAGDNIILRRDTHIDQLLDKLREKRVRNVIEPILVGKSFEGDFNIEDIQYVIDIGLIRRSQNGEILITNRIYQEIIPRELSWSTQMGIHEKTLRYVLPDGRLDMKRLLSAFQDFFRKHSEHWMGRFDYKEAGPQLLMQAFLQRIINSGGRVEREYGLGMMRTDLLIIWKYENKIQEIVIELKLLYESPEQTLKKGLKQTWGYMDKCGTDEGYLIIFDRTPHKSWDEKIYQYEKEFQGKKIQVWGM